MEMVLGIVDRAYGAGALVHSIVNRYRSLNP
jgi:hypothetical protein